MFITTALLAGSAAYLGKKTHDIFYTKKNLIQVINMPPSGGIAPAPLVPYLPKSIQPFLADPPINEDEKEVNHYLAISMVAIGLAGLGNVIFPLLATISVPLGLYTTWPIFKGAYQSIVKEHKLRAIVLDAVAIIGTFAMGYYFAVNLATTLYFVGAKILLKTEDASHKTLTNLFGEQPHFVWRLVDGMEVKTPFEQIQVGDVVVVNAGEMILIDGRIVEGRASVDQHMLTGEAQHVEKEVGDTTLAATIVLGGRIYIEVEKAGTETVASHIGKIMDNTIDYRNVIETRHIALADKTVLPTLGLSALAFSLFGPVSAVAVACANFSEVLRVVGPAGMLNYLRLATQEGILIKDGRALELLKQVDTVVFDKTGTLTLEQPHVENIYCRAGFTAETLLKYAATAEYRQTHPIAKAILQEAENRQLELWSIDAAKYEVGYGLKVEINQQTIRVGSQRFMELEQIITPPELTAALAEVDTAGASLIYVALDETLGGVIELRATIRPEAKAVIQNLKAQGMSLYIISGDHAGPTQKLADSLGIDNFFAEVLPGDKANLVKQLQTNGRFVCFVGDGINDAIALKQANVSVSLRGASTIATDTAQIILMNQNLSQLTEAFELASGFNENSRNTLITTFVPGVICIGGIFFLHFGIYSSIILYNASLAAGITNSMWPWLKQSKQPTSH